MKRIRGSVGFTIVETLIVLGITSVLFVAVAATLSGRKDRTEFSQAAQDIKSRIQQVINDVGTGYYPGLRNLRCTDPTGGTGNAASAAPVISVGSSDQGTNSDCIFLGKVIQFGVGTGDSESMRIYNAFGVRSDANGVTGPDSLGRYSNVRPVVSESAAETQRLLYGLNVKEMYFGNPRSDISSIAIVKSLSNISVTGTSDSGSTQVNIVPIKGTSLHAAPDPATTIGVINTNDHASRPDIGLGDGEVNPSSGTKICFVSGGTNQSALLTIGGNARQLSVTLAIKENNTCS